MSNHPNRSAYARILLKLEWICVDAQIAPDCRRLASAEMNRMRAAQCQPTQTKVKSDASYRNLYGMDDWRAVKLSEQAAAQQEREEMMCVALDSAMRFIRAYPVITQRLGIKTHE